MSEVRRSYQANGYASDNGATASRIYRAGTLEFLGWRVKDSRGEVVVDVRPDQGAGYAAALLRTVA